MAAKQQPGITIRVDDIEDIASTLRLIEQEANGIGELKSAVVAFDEYEAHYADREWTLRSKQS